MAGSFRSKHAPMWSRGRAPAGRTMTGPAHPQPATPALPRVLRGRRLQDGHRLAPPGWAAVCHQPTSFASEGPFHGEYGADRSPRPAAAAGSATAPPPPAVHPRKVCVDGAQTGVVGAACMRSATCHITSRGPSAQRLLRTGRGRRSGASRSRRSCWRLQRGTRARSTASG